VGFKSDREFLRNVSIGAIGTRKVAELLRAAGFRIIELERYSGSNKIWATKIKRVRVPDLLCLKTGIRIESRAKSDLKLTMSHAVNNPDRAWDKGLRDDDLVAFIRCRPSGDTFIPSDHVNLFRVGDLRATATRAGLSQMKAASEGSEIQLTWPSTIPGKAGEILEIDEVSIYTKMDGRRQKYNITRTDDDDIPYRFGVYVERGDWFGPDDTIIASAVEEKIPVECPDDEQYDFLTDLTSTVRETAYCAVKALGYLPEFAKQSIPRLIELTETHADEFIRLEAAGALIRLNEPKGYVTVKAIAGDRAKPKDLRMEVALILSEIKADESKVILKGLAADRLNDSELRAASAWGLSMTAANLDDSGLIPFMKDGDELLAVHAISGATRLLSPTTVSTTLDHLGDDARLSGGVARALLASKIDVVPAILARLPSATGENRGWLIYLLARLGRERVAPHLAGSTAVLSELDLFWKRHEENWTNRLDVADQIDFLLRQILD
jgi:hypothetical protein